MDYELNKGQSSFFVSEAKQTAICSGLGGGKSWVLIFSQIINEIIPYPNAKHCFAALSYQQLKDVSIPMFEEFFEQMGIPYEFQKSSKTFIVNGKTELLMRSEETAHRMRSVQIGSLYVEEMAYWNEWNFKTFLGRLRDKRGSMRMRAATTPNGLNWFYKYFVETKKPGRELVHTSTRDNKHLAEEYIQMLVDSYDTEMLAQELEGQFLTIGAARTYHMFNEKDSRQVRDLHSEGKTNVTNYGLDFNVNPMTGAGGFIENDTIYITDELWLEKSNTFKARNVLNKRHGSNMLIIPDATGKAQKTSAAQSDHDILREVFQVARVRNPSRKDRFNNINRLLQHGRLVIDKRCTKLIRDLNLFADDGSDKTLGHISDALGYLCWYHFPIERFVRKDNHSRKYL